MRRRRRSVAKPLMVVFLLAACGVAAFWYYRPQERPAVVRQVLPIAPQATVEFYRWKDNGQWVVTDTKPPAGVAYETVAYRNDVNVMPANGN